MPSSSRTTTSPRPAACATLSTALAKPDSPSKSKFAPARNSKRPWNAAPPICCSTTSPPMKPPIGSAKSPAAPRSNSPAESPLPTSATMPTSAPTSSPPAPSPTPPAPWTSASAWSCYDRLLNCGAARQAVGRTPWSGCPLGQDALVPHPDQRWQHHAIRRRPWGGPPGRGALWARTPSSRPRATAMIDLARLRQAFPERHILYFESLDSTQRVAAASQPGAIGINVNQPAFPGDIDRLAISLRQHAGREFAREDILFALFPAIDSLIAEDPETVLRLFTHASSYVAGRRVTVDQSGGAITGTTAGLDPAGFLILRQDDGTDTLVLAGGVRATGS